MTFFVFFCFLVLNNLRDISARLISIWPFRGRGRAVSDFTILPRSTPLAVFFSRKQNGDNVRVDF